jgi:hypothetical protein
MRRRRWSRQAPITTAASAILKSIRMAMTDLLAGSSALQAQSYHAQLNPT